MDSKKVSVVVEAEDERAGGPLQTLYWNYQELIGWKPSDYKLAVAKHILSPEFKTRSKATMDDRIQRISTKLSSGNIPALPVDLTWRGFTEGLVITGVETLRICVTTYRGHFKTKTVSEITTRVREDLARDLFEDNDDRPKESATAQLNRYFQNCGETAKMMVHPLSRLTWTIFANMKMNADWWYRLSTNFVNDPANCEQTPSKRNDLRHNMQHNLRLKKKFSWKWFMRVLKAIDVRSFEILLTLRRQKDNKIYEVQVTVNLDEYQIGDQNENRPNNQSDK